MACPGEENGGQIYFLMVGTRGKGEVSTGTNHLGFRTVRSLRMEEAVK